MTAEELRTQWEDLLSAFPWDRGAAVFAEYGWVYGFFEAAYVPGAEVLRRTAASHFESCMAHLVNGRSDAYSCSGRIIVAVSPEHGLELSCEAVNPDGFRALAVRVGLGWMLQPAVAIAGQRELFPVGRIWSAP